MWWIKERMMTKMKTSLIALFSGAAVTLSACAVPGPTLAPNHLRNPIQVAESIERLELYTRPNGLELSARDKLAVAQFLDGYAQSGQGPLHINRPANAAGGLGTRQAETVIRSLMARGGLNPASLQAGQYASAAGAPAPVIVSYRTLRAIPDDCRELGNMSQTYSNQPHANFGCFHSANLAAMVTDPRQLLEPYAQGTPNAQRRQVIYDKYIDGSPTAAAINPGQVVGGE
jgi:pilus assembly protein CpaD